MKKIFLIILTFLLFTSVHAKENNQKIIRNYQSDELLEEVFELKDEHGKIKTINIKMAIPEDYNKDQVIISPSIFKTLNHFKRFDKDTHINFNLEIINNSSINYFYKKDSLLITTEDLKLFDSNNNYKTTGAKSFTGEDILNIYLPYRTKNSALNSLYQNQNYKIDNNSLNNVLTKQGYLGVSELDKFYLDFYNTKYNLEEKFLDDFPLFIKKEILEGEISDIKESNNNLIEFAYNYFYSNIYAFGFSEDVLSDNTSKKLSIKNHYLNKIKEEYFKNIFKKIDSNTTNSIQNMQLYTNKTLMTNAFKDYNYYAHLEFILEKEENVLKEQGMIIPPDTGI